MKNKQNKPLSKTAQKKLLRKLERKADKIFSQYVRALAIKKYNGLCPLCGKNPLIIDPAAPKKKNKWVCFHFVRRKRKILRWDIRNVIGACSRCNYLEYRNPDLSRAWFIRKFGVEVYLLLVDESKKDFSPTVEYLESIIGIYTQKLEELSNN